MDFYSTPDTTHHLAERENIQPSKVCSKAHLITFSKKMSERTHMVSKVSKEDF